MTDVNLDIRIKNLLYCFWLNADCTCKPNCIFIDNCKSKKARDAYEDAHKEKR